MRVDLYHIWECPHCARVRAYLEEHRLPVEVRMFEVDEELAHRAKLVKLTGKPQVPCLVIDGKPLHGAEAIVERLKRASALVPKQRISARPPSGTFPEAA